MKYLVMECHPGYAILLDEEGRFRKAANLHYKVGQTVRDPVWMRTERRRPARWVRSGIAAAAACLLLFLGVQFYQGYLQPYSFIYLTINPEVRMNLNRQGTVVGLAGTNADGEALLEGYDGRGKDKVTVADELIDRAIEMGFLSDGGRVSFSIDAPDEALFQAYGTELRTEVTEHLDGRILVTLEIVDHDRAQEALARPSAPSTATPTPTTPPTATPTPTATPSPEPAQPANTPTAAPPAGDSGYGDSGYDDDNDDGGDSGYDDDDGGDSDYDDD